MIPRFMISCSMSLACHMSKKKLNAISKRVPYETCHLYCLSTLIEILLESLACALFILLLHRRTRQFSFTHYKMSKYCKLHICAANLYFVQHCGVSCLVLHTTAYPSDQAGACPQHHGFLNAWSFL